MKEILKVNNLIKKFPKAGGEIDAVSYTHLTLPTRSDV